VALFFLCPCFEPLILHTRRIRLFTTTQLTLPSTLWRLDTIANTCICTLLLARLAGQEGSVSLKTSAAAKVSFVTLFLSIVRAEPMSRPPAVC
jgi:hypothetical protein